jgi:hypothetical protein
MEYEGKCRPSSARVTYPFIAQDPEAGVLKKLSLAGLAKLNRLRYN